MPSSGEFVIQEKPDIVFGQTSIQKPYSKGTPAKSPGSFQSVAPDRQSCAGEGHKSVLCHVLGCVTCGCSFVFKLEPRGFSSLGKTALKFPRNVTTEDKRMSKYRVYENEQRQLP